MNLLDEVMTLQEAAHEWNFDDSTLRHAISKNKFSKDEVKKSANTWLILKSGMIRLYGNKNDTIPVYTTGYEGRSIETFVEVLKRNDINVIFDVREIPLSRKKGFSKSSLEAILNDNNIKYVHFKELGSPKEIRDQLHQDHDYKLFFSEYQKYLYTQRETLDIVNTSIASNRNTHFCLLCFEKNPAECHRSVVANEIIRQVGGAKIINL